MTETAISPIMMTNITLEDAPVANGDKTTAEVTEEQNQKIERIDKRLTMLDDRLDNIDSMVSAVAERVMSQLVTVNITCPHCASNIEIALIGSQKPTR